MRRGIRAPKDFGIGAIYVLAGVVGVYLGRDYPFGSAARMGPGFFPVVVSYLLLIVGAGAIARSILVDGDLIGVIPWNSTALIIGSVCVFAALLSRAGFVIAAVAMLLTSAAASANFRFQWKAVAGLAALVTFCSLVFIKGLGLPMPIIGPWIRLALPSSVGG